LNDKIDALPELLKLYGDRFSPISVLFGGHETEDPHRISRCSTILKIVIFDEPPRLTSD
jgi:hypothetical protein